MCARKGGAELASAALETDVVVVGAGLAGLACARELERAGLAAAVLEARDRVGGRILGREIAPDTVVELGAQWVGPGQDRVLALAAELGVDTYPTYRKGMRLFEHGDKVTRYRGTIPRLNPLVLAEVQAALWRIDRLARRVPCEAPWEAPRAHRLDAETAASWIRRSVRSATARKLLALAVEAVWACEPEDLSFLHMLFYVRSAGGFERLLETEGGAQERRFVGGSQLLPHRLAAELASPPVLRSPVRRIEWGDDRVTVIADRARFRARRCVVALPPPLACRIEYDPPLPALRDQLAQRTPLGTVIKCMAVYDEPFWRDEGLSGEATSTVGPVGVTFDNSPPQGRPGVLLGFLEGRAARTLAGATVAQRREAVLACFARLFGPRAARPRDFVEHSWADDPWSRGCYGCHFTPGTWTAYGSAWRRPVGSIHWAGAEYATRWNGYMDGAVRSGEETARTLAAELAG